MVKILVEYGADTNAAYFKGSVGYTPVYCLFMCDTCSDDKQKMQKMLELLIGHGANMNALISDNNYSLLAIAVLVEKGN